MADRRDAAGVRWSTVGLVGVLGEPQLDAYSVGSDFRNRRSGYLAEVERGHLADGFRVGMSSNAARTIACAT
jgi:hypothetical protein